MMIKLLGLGEAINSLRNLRKYQMTKFDCLDSLLQNTEGLLSAAGKQKDTHYELPSPIMFELINPLARFSCVTENRELVARSAAETLYAFSGMNGSDFIWEFRGWEDPRTVKHHDTSAIGPSLRFFGRNDDDILDYYRSNNLRQSENDFKDQLVEVIKILKQNNNARNVILQIAAYQGSVIADPSQMYSQSVYQSWLYCRDGKLNMVVWAGYLNSSELIFKYVPIFSFLLQTLAELSGVEIGCVQFTVGCLCTDKIKPQRIIRSIGYPIINTDNFRYPSSNLSLRDMDVLMSIMIEFVSRLDENSLNRANPFAGDDRIQLWQDYANIFKIWKADKLGIKINYPSFFHPQLRFIYNNGESV
jgi:hypothetical protein